MEKEKKMSKPGSLPFQIHLTLGRKGKKKVTSLERKTDMKRKKEGKKREKRKRKKKKKKK